ncbi:uncharacterized protein FTJAE_1946 [Fusarium tjaetaba]|uniref:Uncharacterized protein n=1 Tax=Fusarium tjaetaba TaxID=1567544 RepID=A0A8H5S9Y0_9HYPO|nr:uncharacterized protein FTJAE_1946 [Fusarium tjaetaba]KAF5646656.1 hypothetical protein FTJAE_1946 [Fusarium tjaetaba]
MARRDLTRDTDLGIGACCLEDEIVLAPGPSESHGPALDDQGPSPGSEDENQDEDENPLLDVDGDTSAAGKGNVDNDDHVEQLE